MRTDGQTDMTKLKVAFRNSVKNVGVMVWILARSVNIGKYVLE
jgi:hypothetical protein